jgi:hypothetical protein
MFGIGRKKKTLELLPEKDRPACPFYGFGGMFDDVLMDSGGNQCALKMRRYSPCEMEMVLSKPSWHECPLNTEENKQRLELIERRIRVFPKEFRPLKAGSWKGIPLTRWRDYVIDGKPIKK